MRGSAFFCFNFGRTETECKKNGTQNTVFKGILSKLDYKPAGKEDGTIRPLPKRPFWVL